MRVLNIVFIIVFVISAALQYNDPDPYIWIPLYLFGAWLCYNGIRKNYKPWLYILALFIYVNYALFLFFDRNGVLSWLKDHDAENIVQTMKAAKPWIEETREFGGLLILIVASVVNIIYLRKFGPASSGSNAIN
jgi:hypothetical protein